MSAAAAAQRRTCQPVRRESLDVDDPRAQVFRPIEGGIAYADEFVRALKKWTAHRKLKGDHDASQNRVAVAEAVIRSANYANGICEPSIDYIRELTGLARATVVAALDFLRRKGFLDWLRRTEKTGNDPGDGPQVRQITNAYWFDMARLPRAVAMEIAARMRKRDKPIEIPREPRLPIFGASARRARGRAKVGTPLNRLSRYAAARTPEEQVALIYPGNPEAQREHLDMLSASSKTSQNPPSRIKYEVETIG